MKRIFFLIALITVFVSAASAQAKIVQVSDTHIGLSTAPDASANMTATVNKINKMIDNGIAIDAVFFSGDVAEHNTTAYTQFKSIANQLKVPWYAAPGNHDIHNDDPSVFTTNIGPNYQLVTINGIRFIILDSGLLGNYDTFPTETTLSSAGETRRQAMFTWLDAIAADTEPTFFMLHIPPYRYNGNFPTTSQTYWVLQEPYLSQFTAELARLGVHHVFAGHWHADKIFVKDGVQYHVAPATGYSLNSGTMGFYIHDISATGCVSTTRYAVP